MACVASDAVGLIGGTVDIFFKFITTGQEIRNNRLQKKVLLQEQKANLLKQIRESNIQNVMKCALTFESFCDGKNYISVSNTTIGKSFGVSEEDWKAVDMDGDGKINICDWTSFWYEIEIKLTTCMFCEKGAMKDKCSRCMRPICFDHYEYEGDDRVCSGCIKKANSTKKPAPSVPVETTTERSIPPQSHVPVQSHSPTVPAQSYAPVQSYSPTVPTQSYAPVQSYPPAVSAQSYAPVQSYSPVVPAATPSYLSFNNSPSPATTTSSQNSSNVPSYMRGL